MQPGEFLLYVKSFNKLYNQMIQTEADRHGLTLIEADILLFLYNNPQYDTAKDISSYRMLAKSGVSASVENLMRLNLLDGAGDESDRRKIHLTLTGTAQEIAAGLKKAQEHFFSHLNRGITEEERQTFSEVLTKMANNLTASEPCV